MNRWADYCVSHPNLHLAKVCIDNTPPQQFWSLTDPYRDLVRLHDLEATWLKVVFLFPFIVNYFIVLAFRLSSVKHMMCKINYDELKIYSVFSEWNSKTCS